MATCDTKRPVRVVDEAGAPVAGARVRIIVTSRQCGPSGLPEACGTRRDESPVVITDASGTAKLCGPAIPFDVHVRASVVVEYGDWPTATVPAEAARTITIGPGRSATVEVPAACSGMQHVHVHAWAEGGGEAVTATPIAGGLRSQRYRLANLGPWQYWVRSRDDRSGNSALEPDACSSFVRVLDGRRAPPSLVLDRSDTLLDVPTFAGARVTATAFDRPDEVVASGELDAEGRGLLTLPASAGTAFCIRLDQDGRCRITYVHAGALARPDAYANQGPARWRALRLETELRRREHSLEQLIDLADHALRGIAG